MNLRRQLAHAQLHSAARPVPLTAMIDIVFLLLIFFLFGSFDFAEQQVLAALAGDQGQSVSAEQSIWLRLRSTNHDRHEFAVDSGPWTSDASAVEDTLRTRLVQSALPPAIIIKPGLGVTLQDLIDAYALSQSVGFERIAIYSGKASP